MLDENGQYTVTRVVENVPYDLKAYPCATLECIAFEANIDPAGGDHEAWRRAQNAKTLNDASTAGTIAAMATPAGWATYATNAVTTSTGIYAAYLENDLLNYGAESAVEEVFSTALDMVKVPDKANTIITNSLSVGGVFETVVTPLDLPDYPGNGSKE